MNSATRSVAVVATRLPNIDRRALSQAWFSALHLAQPAGGARLSPSRPAVLAGGGFVRRPVVAPAPPAERPAPAALPVRPRRAATAIAATPAAERRRPAGEIGRRIEAAITRQTVRSAPQRTFAIDVGEGRVHVLVRTDGASTRIIALCAPQLRERVDRALAQARYGLAAAGLRVEVLR